ncbi:MAG: hypothetical protein IT165_19260 [Bryobacterales bacterium]|nr:hypothetical protein [Bryobacterales bacterium]
MSEHLTEQQLVLLYYGESREAGAESHLECCDECRAQYRSLQGALNLVDGFPIPERSPEYGSEVWRRIERRLPCRPRVIRWLGGYRQWAAAAALACLLAAAFLAGRYSRSASVARAVPASDHFDERVLLSAVGNHLDRTQLVLVELANSRPAPHHQHIDIEAQQEDIRDLLEANRLYRTSAAQAGERAVADVLDELERLLVEVAHTAPRLTAQEADELRERITGEGILFRVRVTESGVRAREKQLESGKEDTSL